LSSYHFKLIFPGLAFQVGLQGLKNAIVS